MQRAMMISRYHPFKGPPTCLGRVLPHSRFFSTRFTPSNLSSLLHFVQRPPVSNKAIFPFDLATFLNHLVPHFEYLHAYLTTQALFMMTTNLTIDDSSTDIIYSSNWAVQDSADDPSTNRFFQSTYHSAQEDGASANLTFNGLAIYLYGSKGPGHANYSVQFDNFIIFYSANQSETEYQQLLFGQIFNTSGTHFLSLTSHHASSTENWLDLDYITITVNETDSDSGIASSSSSPTTTTASATIPPPWVLEATSSTAGSSGVVSSTASTVPTQSSSSSTSITLILAAVFGGIIVVGVIFGVGFFLARRRKKRRDNQRPYRPGTPENRTGAGSAFAYKPPPSPPSFFGGQMSPISPEAYPAQSPAYDRLLSEQELEKHVPSPGHVHGALLDGRKSPHSTVSLGGMTMLTAASTAYLLNPHQTKTVEDSIAHRPIEPTSTAAVRPDTGINTGRPIPQPRQTSANLPIYKQHRVFDSESAINVLKASAARHAGIGNDYARPAVTVVPGNSTTPPLIEKTDARREAGERAAPKSQIERAVPLMALHAAHRSDSDLSTNTRTGPGAPPQRPKRPGDGLLDFIGNQLAQRLERSASAKRRKDDGNSERTNFLKV